MCVFECVCVCVSVCACIIIISLVVEEWQNEFIIRLTIIYALRSITFVGLYKTFKNEVFASD